MIVRVPIYENMDPASAAFAAVSFAASLVTLATLVVDSSKTLYNLRQRLKNGPEDIERLRALGYLPEAP